MADINAMLDKAEIIRQRWAADWHRDIWHRVSHEYVRNEIRDLLDVIAALKAQVAPMQVDANELLPCPFCGQPATLKRLNAYYFTVECVETCRCMLPGFLSAERAKAAWNRRTTAPFGFLAAESSEITREEQRPKTQTSAAATATGEPVLLVDEPDKFGTITVWVDKRERFQPRVEVHTTDFADDGSLIPDYKLYFYNRTFEIQEAHDFARAILLGCEIAEQHAQQRPSAQDGAVTDGG